MTTRLLPKPSFRGTILASGDSLVCLPSIEPVKSRPIEHHARGDGFTDELRNIRPHAGALPFRQPIPARHSRTATHISRQLLEGLSCRKQIHESGQDVAIGETFAARAAVSTPFGRRQNRRDSLPQLIVNVRDSLFLLMKRSNDDLI